MNIRMIVAASCLIGGAVMAEGVVLKPGVTEVIIAPKASDNIVFAAEEMTNFLSQVLGAEVPVARKPSPGKTGIFLGVNEWSRKAGIDVAEEPRDTFRIRTGKDRVYIVGRDAEGRQIRSCLKKGGTVFERATLFGVYEFLERYAGVRFYFPGELGTIVPKKNEIQVGDVDCKVTPEYTIREWYSGRRAYWFGKTANDDEGSRMKSLAWLRLRMGTYKIPLCHGQRKFYILERFGKTHPEYFALKSNGARHNDPNVTHPGHLCWTSPVVDVIYEDIKCAFSGGKPADRGITQIKSWGNNFDFIGKVVDLMPQDGQAECLCERCKAVRDAGDNEVWLATKSIAERLVKDGFDVKVPQMCYGRNRKVPAWDIPTNVIVQIAVRGQWGVRDPRIVQREHDMIFAWQKKLGHKVWLWTYPGKHPSVGPDFDGIPQLSMHSWVRYYADLRDSIIGGFSESETDRYSFNYLNYYVYSRMCWDTHIDVDKILDEHYALMFGKGAEPMKKLYGILEEKWMSRLAGESRDTPIGPVGFVPTWAVIFSEIYPPAEIARLDALVAEALNAVEPGSLEARRIKMMSDEFIGGIRSAEKTYRERVAAVDAYRMKVSKDQPLKLRPFIRHGKKFLGDENLSTTVAMWQEGDALKVRFTCEEPHMDSLEEKARQRDDKDIWKDNCVELFLVPSLNRSRHYHIMVNSCGSIKDDKVVSFGGGKRGASVDDTWGKGVTAKVDRGEKGWTAEITIPVGELEGFVAGRPMPVNFTRNRVLNGISGTGLYLWGPESILNFNNAENFGTVEY